MARVDFFSIARLEARLSLFSRVYVLLMIVVHAFLDTSETDIGLRVVRKSRD